MLRKGPTQKFPFAGKSTTSAPLALFLKILIAQLRFEAAGALWKYYDEASVFNEKCFDDLVKTRHQIARELGYDNFVQLGYTRMLRSDLHTGDGCQFSTTGIRADRSTGF